MTSATKQAAQAFGERLRSLMKQRGFTSDAAACGVDVGLLAQVTGATYEMARRYASGEAMPRAGKLHAIAQWLGIEASELAYGAATSIDEGLLEKCITAVEQAQKTTGAHMPAEKVARLVAILYKEAMAGGLPDARAISLMARALM